MKKFSIAVVLGLALLAGGAVVLVRQQSGEVAAGKAPSGSGPVGGAGRAAGAPPVSVTTVKAEQRDQVVAIEATGTVSSLNSVDIRPQVSSVITRVHVREGQSVRRGDPLFSLDDRSDSVNLTKARAQLARDQAALADAQRQLARSRDLLEQKFVSQSAVDSSRTLVETQQAVVASGRAAVDAAQLSLGYNRISAPSGGRVGAINVFAGSYVQPSGAALLTITQLDPIAVSFNLPQRHLADALQGLRAGQLPVTVRLPGGVDAATATTLSGRLQFVDSAVDQSSGTVRVKAVFDNPRQLLWPGAYVNVSLSLQTLKDVIVVPQTAVVTGANGRSLFVVDGSGKAALRPVELIHSAGADAVVSGIEAGTDVIVGGRENVRPGSSVVVRGGAAAAQPGASRPADAARTPGAAAATTP